MLRAVNLSKKFEKSYAVENLCFNVKRGDVFGFIGSNGAGKTTTMRMLVMLLKPTSGQIYIEGLEAVPDNYVKLKSQIGFMPQNTRFNENLEPCEVIRFFCNLRGCDSKKHIDLFREIQGDMSKKAKYLSPGQQKKLQIVLALTGSPEILILDEPTAGLDPAGVNEFRDIVKDLRSNGHTIFISSHNLKELDNLCNSVAIIHKGRILFAGEYRNAFEIETESDLSKDCERKLMTIAGGKCRLDGNRIIACLERKEIPGFIKNLAAFNIPVYGVKDQSIEVLYNDIIKGAV